MHKYLFFKDHSNIPASIIHSCSLHPFMPLVASSSGQRQFCWPSDSEEAESDSEESHVISSNAIRQDNALVLWWAGPVGPTNEREQEEEPVVL